MGVLDREFCGVAGREHLTTLRDALLNFNTIAWDMHADASSCPSTQGDMAPRDEHCFGCQLLDVIDALLREE